MLPLFAALALLQNDPVVALRDRGLKELGAFSLLAELTASGPRLSGSPGYERAVDWGEATMRRLGFANVRRMPVTIPHWTRGAVTRCAMGRDELACCALGGSVGGDVEAEVIEVRSLEEATALGDRAKGKIVFFNGAFDPTTVATMSAYGKAVGQRTGGASVAAKVGAVAVLVRSMTLAEDETPHTGTMIYEADAPRIPAAALAAAAANRLSVAVKAGPVRVRLRLDCARLPDVESSQVVGELVGREKPGEVIVMGGHLDSWDLGDGAHDDGAGIVQSLEALRLIGTLGAPKRTIRVVLFADEEQTGTGSAAYLVYAKGAKERHLAAIESDSGGFMPRQFSTSLSGRSLRKLQGWLPGFMPLGIERFVSGGNGGADVGPLGEVKAALFGLTPDNARYFDYHHSAKDTLDKVNPRELEFGAIAMATLAWQIAEKGL